MAFVLCFSSSGFASPWTIKKGFRFTKDATGFVGPTGLAFVNGRKAEPRDPLYLVAGLRGPIWSVSGDRHVARFAETPGLYEPDEELPDLAGEIGQIGLCFTKDGSRLFSTAVTLEGKTRINRITVWKPQDEAWRKGRVERHLTELFAKAPASNPHQIGFCTVDSHGHLWVGTGDGAHHRTTHRLDYPNGKLFRLKANLTATPSNPFFDPQNPEAVESFVYASGFRNPFSIALTPADKPLVADNGPNVDRLLAVMPGRDYPWNGKNESFIYDTQLTWPKSIGPAGMVYVPEGHSALRSLGRHLVVAGSYERKLYAIPVDPDSRTVTGPPKTLVSSRNAPKGAFTGVALGPDGLYVSFMKIHKKKGLLPSPVYKLAQGQTKGNAPKISGARLFERSGCRGCHVMDGRGSPVGPPLDNVVDRLKERFRLPGYLEDFTGRLKKTADEGLAEPKKAFLEASDVQEKLGPWLQLKILNPRIEKPKSGMAVQEVSPKEAGRIAAYLKRAGDLSQREPVKEERISERVKWFLKQNPESYAVIALGVGFAAGWGLRRPRWRRGAKPS